MMPPDLLDVVGVKDNTVLNQLFLPLLFFMPPPLIIFVVHNKVERMHALLSNDRGQHHTP